LFKISNKTLKIIFKILFVIFIAFFVSNLFLRLMYPVNYGDYIEKYSKNFGVDPYLVAAIINVESKYDEDARSHKDARGLMQISLVTGEWAFTELNIDGYTLDKLYEPETNIMVGCWYLNVLQEEFNGDLRLVLAAYNGGSGNVSKWLKDEKYSKDGKTLDRIPYKETEEYVNKVLRYNEIYRKVYKNGFMEEERFIKNNFVYLINNFKKLLKKFVTIVR